MLRPMAATGLLPPVLIGRSLRPSPGKERALILDFCGPLRPSWLARSCRPPGAWTPSPAGQRERPDGPRLRRCSALSIFYRAAAHTCMETATGISGRPKERREIEVALGAGARRREEEDQVRPCIPRYAQLDWARRRRAAVAHDRANQRIQQGRLGLLPPERDLRRATPGSAPMGRQRPKREDGYQGAFAWR